MKLTFIIPGMFHLLPLNYKTYSNYVLFVPFEGHLNWLPLLPRRL